MHQDEVQGGFGGCEELYNMNHILGSSNVKDILSSELKDRPSMCVKKKDEVYQT